MDSFGVALTGEWSLAVNDCGRYVVCAISAGRPLTSSSRFLNGMNDGSRFEGSFPTVEEALNPAVGSCAAWAVSGARQRRFELLV